MSSPSTASHGTFREVAVVAGLAVAADLFLFRGHGGSGLAAFAVLAPILGWIAVAPTVSGRDLRWLWPTLFALATRLVWQSSFVTAVVTLAFLVAFTLVLQGRRPFVTAVLMHGSQAIPSGYRRLVDYARQGVAAGPRLGNVPWLSFVMPVGVGLAFGVIFILANPDLANSVWSGAEQFLNRISDWLAHVSIAEGLFVFAVIWLSAGLLRPQGVSPFSSGLDEDDPRRVLAGEPSNAQLFAPCRNTLVTLIVLFAIYLVFEFQTLWFREFPPGFHYSGYAHRGAAWLTAALALATGFLSLVFRGDMLADARIGGLRKLAWVWSAQNLVLAVAAFHRLYLYVGFNGLTQMRIVGLFGTATVVAGLVLVLWKIHASRNVVWLVRRQLWSLAAAVTLYSLTPVDAIWVDYNVRRILEGDPKPSVELAAHPISPEGYLCLFPLLQCRDAQIREGIKAMLADESLRAEKKAGSVESRHWTTFQTAESLLLKRLRAESASWSEYQATAPRERALKAFQHYTYQWW